MDAACQISREARDAIIDSVQTGLGGIDIGLNRQRARDNARDNFFYSTDDEIDNMSIEELRTHAKHCRNGWHDLILHEEEGVGSVCLNGQGGYFNVICNFHIYKCLFESTKSTRECTC